jgi:amino-acid N-acetyltransferase
MKVSDLRGILQYVPRFRDRIFVVSIDGEIIASENFPNILLDLAVLRSLNIKIVLVHGASFQIEKLARERGITLSNTDGTGITDEQTLQVSLDASVRLTNEILQGLTAVDLRAAFANAIIAHPSGILGGTDYLFTGKVEKVDTRCLQLFLADGIVPLIPPLGYDGEGRTFRVNSDSIAVEVAEALQAAKVIFISRHDGLMSNGEIIRQISVTETEDLLRRKRLPLSRGLISKLEHAARACRQGVPRVHLINGNVDEALLTEVFSNEGVGTMIHSNEYQQIRRMYKKDVRQVMALIRQSVKNEELVRRTRSEIVQSLEDYWLLEVDRNILGCVALHVYPEESKAELACLYVSKNHENQGYGRKLMAFVEDLARSRGVKEIFALSTQAYMYLIQKGGFTETTPDFLPKARREKFEASGRNSRILKKAAPARPTATPALP